MLKLARVRELRLRPSADFPEGPDAFAAASGLVVRGDRAIVVSDDDCSLGIFALSGGEPGERLRILPDLLPRDPAERKRRKPDFETLVEWPAEGAEAGLLAIPSGSKSNRVRGAYVSASFDAGAPAREIDFSDLFARLGREWAGLNLEGATVGGESLYLFQRGNRAGSANAVITLDRREFGRELLGGRIGPGAIRSIARIDLGSIGDVRLGFGDAAADSRGRIWFLASAEATEDPYLDGAYAGAILGRMNSDLSGVEEALSLPLGTKPEGLAFDPSDERAFYLVTDADDPTAVSELFRGRLD